MNRAVAFVAAALSCFVPVSSAQAQAPTTPPTVVPTQPAPPAAPSLPGLPLNLAAHVFASRTFPTVDFAARADAEKLIGPYTVAARYFDKDHKEVRDAAKTGRYGAIVEVRDAKGQVRDTRYVTLYRAPRLPVPDAPPLPIAKEYGFSAQQLVAQLPSLEDYASAFSDTPRLPAPVPLATLLAGLSETRAGDPPVLRFSARERDRRWWYEQKKRLGLSGPYRHLVQTPPGYEQGKEKYPVLLFLHGAGERGDDTERAGVHGPLRYVREGHSLPFLVVVPQCEVGDRWLPTRVIDLLNEVTKKYRVDTSRVYLTGLSMGGQGTWATATEFPNRFAAILPVCGRTDPADAQRLVGTPVWAFHGDQDPTVPVRHTVDMVNALKALNAPDVYSKIYSGVGHDSWTETYNNPDIYTWLLKYRKP